MKGDSRCARNRRTAYWCSPTGRQLWPRRQPTRQVAAGEVTYDDHPRRIEPTGVAPVQHPHVVERGADIRERARPAAARLPKPAILY